MLVAFLVIMFSQCYIMQPDCLHFSHFNKCLNQVCLSKGLGAPVGSVIVGSKGFIAKVIILYFTWRVYFCGKLKQINSLLLFQAKRLRKTLGGAMRQVGVLCAAAYVALQDNAGKLADDHKKTKMLAGNLFTISF